MNLDLLNPCLFFRYTMRQLDQKSGKIQEGKWIFLLQVLELVEPLLELVDSSRRRILILRYLFPVRVCQLCTPILFLCHVTYWSTVLFRDWFPWVIIEDLELERKFHSFFIFISGVPIWRLNGSGYWYRTYRKQHTFRWKAW